MQESSIVAIVGGDSAAAESSEETCDLTLEQQQQQKQQQEDRRRRMKMALLSRRSVQMLCRNEDENNKHDEDNLSPTGRVRTRSSPAIMVPKYCRRNVEKDEDDKRCEFYESKNIQMQMLISSSCGSERSGGVGKMIQFSDHDDSDNTAGCNLDQDGIENDLFSMDDGVTDDEFSSPSSVIYSKSAPTMNMLM
jgi:hypothetical protein